MRLKLFARNTRHRQLCDLYRSAEESSRVAEADEPSRQAFAADEKLIAQMTRLAAQTEPNETSLARATLLARVARKKSHSEEEMPMIRQLFQKRTIAVAAAATLLLGAAVTVGAAGGVSDVAGNVADVLDELNIIDRTPDQADTHIDGIQQPDGQESAADGMETANDHADGNASDGLGTAADAQNQEVALPDEASDNAEDGAANGDDHPSIPDAVPDGVNIPLP